MLDRGFSIEDAAAIRGLETSAIVRHATWMVKKGNPIPTASLLGEDDLERWTDTFRRTGPAGPPPEGHADAQLWPLFVACRSAGLPTN